MIRKRFTPGEDFVRSGRSTATVDVRELIFEGKCRSRGEFDFHLKAI